MERPVIAAQDILRQARDFAERNIRPRAAQFEEQLGIPRELIREMAELGYLAAPFPRQYGGLGLDPVDYGLLTEIIGQSCCSTRSLLTTHTSLVGETLVRWGSEEQKKEWLPQLASGEKLAAFALTEPETGSDARHLQSTYTTRTGGYVLTGRKKWITFGGLADVFLVFACHDRAMTAFLVEKDTPGVRTVLMKGLLASRAAYLAEIEFSDVFVSRKQVLGGEGNGFSYIANTALDYGRYSVAWAGAAIARAAMEAMVQYARQRKQFGQRIYQHQLIQGIIGDAVTQVHAARALCLRAGELRRSHSDDAVIETSIAKYFTSQAAMKVAADAVQVHGGNGCSNYYPVERLYREAKVLEIIEGSSQMQQIIIAKHGLQRYFI